MECLRRGRPPGTLAWNRILDAPQQLVGPELPRAMAQATQRVQSKEKAVTAMQETVERWGKEQSSQMVFAKLFPGPPVQVRMIYNTTYEKGNAQERFIWTSDGKQATLLQYQVVPGWADEKTIKSLSSP